MRQGDAIEKERNREKKRKKEQDGKIKASRTP
jgi:hypothetical protein